MISIWYDANNDPLQIPEGNQYSTVLVVHVDPGSGGTVELQFKDSDEVWYTPDVFQFTEKRPQMIEYNNLLPLQVIATGTAKFQVSTALKSLENANQAAIQ